mgnify:CR=1 FL=1
MREKEQTKRDKGKKTSERDRESKEQGEATIRERSKRCEKRTVVAKNFLIKTKQKKKTGKKHKTKNECYGATWG